MNTKKLKQEFRQMVKDFDGEKARDNIAGSMCEHYAIEFAKRVPGRSLVDSLDEAKQEVAEAYSKKDWKCVLRDFEYGLGISKMVDFEDLMDTVAEVYKGES